jgi:hypothetical protein
MTKEDAIQFQKMIENHCQKFNVWFMSTHENKPGLKGIRMELSIKVEPTTTIKGEATK